MGRVGAPPSRSQPASRVSGEGAAGQQLPHSLLRTVGQELALLCLCRGVGGGWGAPWHSCLSCQAGMCVAVLVDAKEGRYSCGFIKTFNRFGL